MNMNINNLIPDTPNILSLINNPLPNNLQTPIPIPSPQNPPIQVDNKRHRRSKHDPEGRTFKCDCGKSFLSKPALNNHIKKKHPDTPEGQINRPRGRPRKYPPKTSMDFENMKYPYFFDQAKRKAEVGKNLDDDMPNLVQKIFDELYKGEFKDKLFSCPKSVEEEPILNYLSKKTELDEKIPKNERQCNMVFYEYLKSFKNLINDKYFILITKFVLLFRECFDLTKNKDKTQEERAKLVGTLTPEGLPDLCNEFYGEFLINNEFFGINDQDDRDEIIELIQHFCIWLYKNEYTKSKLSLAPEN